MTAPRSPQPDPRLAVDSLNTTVRLPTSPDPSEAAVTEGPFIAYFTTHGEGWIVTDRQRPSQSRIATVSTGPDDYGRANTILIADALNAARQPSAPERPDLTALIAETERDHGPRGGYFENSGYCRRCDEALPCLAMRFRAALRAEHDAKLDRDE